MEKKVNFRSPHEEDFSERLTEQKVKWQYEPTKFKLGKTSYTPDFYLPEDDLYIELIRGTNVPVVKRKKLEVFRRCYPKVRLKVIVEMNFTRINVSIDKKTLALVDKIAIKHHWSRSKVLKVALVNYLKLRGVRK